MPGWTWIEEPPVYWTIIARTTWGHAAVTFILFFTVPLWARSTPDATHRLELRMISGHLYYLSPLIGWYIRNGVWIAFGLLGFLVLVMFIHRKKVRRTR